MTRWIIVLFCSGFILDIAYSASILNITSEASDGDEGASEILYNRSLNQTRESRRSKLFNEVCTTTNGIAGTCMSRFSCMRQGGTVSGFCGTYGVCCEITLRCGGTSSEKRVIINNPATMTTNTCTYTIERSGTNVCQMLIEFNIFELQQPVLDENTFQLECTDQFLVDDFALCGINSGQHLYLHLNAAPDRDQATLTFNIPSRWTQTRYNLIVTQLECPVVKNGLRKQKPFSSFLNTNYVQDLRTIFATHHSDYDLIAPFGCNQYYRAATGNIRSFNFQMGMNSYYMSNMNYVICIKAAMSANSIRYRVNSFSLSQEIATNPGAEEDCYAAVTTPDRREDYLMIPRSNLMNNPLLKPTYYCGTFLQTGQSVIGSPPFVMYFNSDEKTDTAETGFSIDYSFT